MADNIGIKFTGDATDLQKALGTSGAGVEQFSRKATADLNRFGQASEISAKQTAFAMRGLPAQFTDIVTSLQGGQKPITVLLQQGGQIKDMFGGIGPAAKAMGSYVMGLANPYTVVAAAVVALGVAYYQGSQDASAFTKALALSNNAAGQTAGGLMQMAEQMAKVQGTQGGNAEVLAEFAASGNIASDSLMRFSTIAIGLEREAGQPVKKTIEIFNELGNSPVEASARLNQSTHHLTDAVWQQIKALEDQGRIVEAGAVAQKAYADATEVGLKRISDNLGTLERGWRRVWGAAKDAWDLMANVGRGTTVQEQLASAQKELATLQSMGAADPYYQKTKAGERDALREKISFLSESVRLEKRSAESAKQAADQVRARVSFDQEGDAFLGKREKMEKAITETRIKGAAAGAKQSEIDERVAQIKEKYKDKAGARAAVGMDKAQRDADIEAIKKANDSLVDNYSNAEKIVESLHAAGQLTEAEYYQAKIAFVNLASDANTTALNKEISRYQQEQLLGKDRIDNDKKIAAAQAAIGKVQQDADAKKQILANQEEARVNKLKVAYLTARQAAEDYAAVQQRQQGRAISAVGTGNQQRDFNSGVNQIEDRYADQRRDLENEKARLQLEGKFTADAKAQYDQRLAIINEFQSKSIDSFTKYYGDLIGLQGSWSLGAKEALTNYYNDSRDVFKQTENLVTNAFKGMEDALVSFATTGKLDFKSLADSIIADMVRMQVKALLGGLAGPSTNGSFSVSSLMGGGGLSGLLSGMFGGGALASSGVMAGGLDGMNSYDGGGYTGGGSRSGGLDGKGGFTALLHPNESVVDHTRGQTLAGDTHNYYSFGEGVSRSEVISGLQQVRAVASDDQVQRGRRGRAR